MSTAPTGPDGSLIDIRPIAPDEFGAIYPGCWPGHGSNREAPDRLFASQGTLGMAAWDGEECVGSLHCYRVIAPDGRNEDWPPWTEWWLDHCRPEAMEYGYVAVVAAGASEDLWEYATWSAHLPWTTYARLGFQRVDVPAKQAGEIPDHRMPWPEGHVPPAVGKKRRQPSRLAGRSPTIGWSCSSI